MVKYAAAGCAPHRRCKDTTTSTNVAALAFGLMLALIGLSGCFGFGDSAKLAMYVKDAPSDDYSEVWVTFTEIRIQESSSGGVGSNDTDFPWEGGNETDDGLGNDTDTGMDSEDTDPTGWVTIFEDPGGVSVNLLNFSGEARAFMGVVDLEPATYQEIRVTVSEAWGVTLNGTREDFAVATTEVSIAEPFEIVGNETTAVTVDFDLDASIIQTGGFPTTSGNATGNATFETGGATFDPVIGDVIVEPAADDPPMFAKPGDPGPNLTAAPVI